MNDNVTLIATGILGVFFVVCGILNILDNFIIKTILLIGFCLIIVYIIVVKSRDDDHNKQKNLPK